MHAMAVQDYNYNRAQRQLNTWAWSVSSAPEGDVSTTCYVHAGAFWDFSLYIKQSLSAGVLKIPVHAVYHQA